MNTAHKELIAKGNEIVDIVHKIGELIPEDSEVLQDLRGQVMADAMTMVAKVHSAEAGNLYDLRMENAAIIRKAARDLMVSKHSFEMFGFEHVDYFDIVRNLIEEYRLIFIRWVQSFDPWDYIIDRWALFNPPGVGPFDKDPDDDIPFDGPYDEDE